LVAAQLSQLALQNLSQKRHISDLEDIRAVLASAEARYGRAIRGTSDGIWDWDMLTGEDYHSPRYWELLGYAEEELPHTLASFKNLVHPDDLPVVEAATRDHLELRKPYNPEFRMRVKSGEYRWFCSRGQAEWDSDGTPFRMAGSITDITDRKRAEEATKLNEARLESLHRVSFHPAKNIQELLDYTLDEAIELTDSKIGYIYFYDEEKKEFTLNSWSKDVLKQCSIVEPRTTYQLEKTGIWGEAVRQRRPIMVNQFSSPNPHKKGTPEGHAPLHRFLTIPVFSGDRIIAVVGVANKADEYNDSDIRQLTLMMDAVWKIAQRKANEEELRIAKEKAESATQAKSEFLSAMSHEIRTPLNGVIGFSALLMDTPLSEEQRDFLESVHSSAEILLSLVNHILDLSKVEANKIELELLPFRLRETLKTSVDAVLPSALAKGFSVRTQVDASCPEWLLGDEVRFRQVLVNLLGNAVKFTEHGNVDLVVDVVEGEETPDKESNGCGQRLRVRVRDTGIGISPSQQEKIFRPFSQGDSSMTRRYGGTGLGLAISQKLVELMAGRLSLESTPGVGSTFSFSIPLAQPNPGADAVSPVLSSPTLLPTPSPFPLKILLAEDNPTNRKLCVKILERQGWSVDQAVNGREAVLAAKANFYDIILMDMEMPEMNGLDATREIRSLLPADKQPWILSLTAHAAESHREISLSAGMDDYLSKPLTPASLAAALLRAKDSLALRRASV